MKLQEIISPDGIDLALEARDKKSVLKVLVDLTAKVYPREKLKVPDVVQALLRREQLGSTGLGQGVAVPHAKLPDLGRIIGVFGKTTESIEFNALDGESVVLFFLLLSPENQPHEHVAALQRISQAIKQPNFARFLRAAKDAEVVWDLFQEVDEAIRV